MRRIRDMNWYEQTFLATAAALLGGTIVAVAISSPESSWSEPTFLMAFITFVVLGVQFIVRYVAVATLHRTEVSPSAWAVSLLILVTSLALVVSIHHPRPWFVLLGFLLLFGALKNTQTRRRIRASVESNDEKLMRSRSP